MLFVLGSEKSTKKCLFAILQNEDEADGNAGGQRKEASQVEGLQVGSRAAVGAARGARAAAAAVQARVDGDAGGGRAAAGGRCRAGRGGVGLLRVLSTAGVVLTARAGTAAVGTASLHALGAPFCAGEVRQSQGVLGDVWLHVVAAKTSVCECFRITGVCDGCSRLDLFTDERACCRLLLAPCRPRGQRYTIGIDIVVGTDGGGKQGDCCHDGRLERKHGSVFLFLRCKNTMCMYKKY